MAVVFFASTNLREIVFRRLLIFSASHITAENDSAPSNVFLPGLHNAASTSSFKIFPPVPDGVIVLGSTFLSAIIAEATGDSFHIGSFMFAFW